jgi:hypothetical protein
MFGTGGAKTDSELWIALRAHGGRRAMKNRAMVGLVCVVLLAAGALVAADAAVKPEKGVIVGTAVELSTYAIQGLGEGSTDAMVARCEQGFPVGIVDEETGAVWVCIYRSNAPASGIGTANETMQEFMGKKVAAQGLKYAAKGVNVLRLSVISEY